MAVSMQQLREKFDVKKVKFNNFHDMSIDEKEEFIFKVIKSILVNELKIENNFMMLTDCSNVNNAYIYVTECDEDVLEDFNIAIVILKDILAVANDSRNFIFVSDDYDFFEKGKYKVYEIEYNGEKIEYDLVNEFSDLTYNYPEIKVSSGIKLMSRDFDGSVIIKYTDKTKLKDKSLNIIFNMLGIRGFQEKKVFPNRYNTSYKYVNLSQMEYIGESMDDIIALTVIKAQLLKDKQYKYLMKPAYIHINEIDHEYYVYCYNVLNQEDEKKCEKYGIRFFNDWNNKIFDCSDNTYEIIDDYEYEKTQKAADNLKDAINSLVGIWKILLKRSCNKYEANSYDIRKYCSNDNFSDILLKSVSTALGCNIKIKNGTAKIEYYRDFEKDEIHYLKLLLEQLNIKIDEKSSKKLYKENALKNQKVLSDIKEIDLYQFTRLFDEEDEEALYAQTIERLIIENNIDDDIYIIYRTDFSFKNTTKKSELTVYCDNDYFKCLRYINELFKLKSSIECKKLKELESDLEMKDDLLFKFKINDSGETNEYETYYGYDNKIIENKYCEDNDRNIMKVVNKINDDHYKMVIFYDGDTVKLNKEIFNKYEFNEELIRKLFELYNIKKLVFR